MTGRFAEAPLTVRAWRELVEFEIPEIERPSMEALAGMTREERIEDAVARLNYFCNSMLMDTPLMRDVIDRGLETWDLNLRPHTQASGFSLSAPSYTGKTTAIRALGKDIQQRSMAMAGWHDDMVPVIYTLMPDSAGSKTLALNICEFLGVSFGKGILGEITTYAVNQIKALGTALLIVDEAHNLGSGDKRGARAAAHLRDIAERCQNLTIVLCGNALENTSLQKGPVSFQIQQRFPMMKVDPIPRGPRAAAREWKDTVASLEGNLLLANHEPGYLLSLEKQLHEFTDGYIGRLARLFDTMLYKAILSGRETIDLQAVDVAVQSVRPDRYAQWLVITEKLRAAAT